MSKLRAPVFVTTWPTVALAAIVCFGLPLSSANPFKSAREVLGYGHKVFVEDRSDDYWKEQGMGALEEIEKKDSKGIVPDGAKHWLENLKGISRETDCNGKMADDLYNMQSMSEKFKRFSKIYNEYYDHYLVKCGLEEAYKRAIEEFKQKNPEHWSSNKRSTLRKYIGSEHWTVDEAKKLLSIVQDISDLEGAPKSSICTDEYLNDVLKRLLEDFGDLRLFLRVYSDSYLDKCGFEERFQKAIDTLKPIDPEERNAYKYKTTLQGFIEQRRWATGEIKELLSIIRDITEFESIPEETRCTDEEMIENLMKRFPKAFEHISEFRNGYGLLYSEKCGYEERFKKAIANIEQVSAKRWKSLGYSSLYWYLRFGEKNWNRNQEAQLLVTIREISKPDSIVGPIGCTEKHVSEVAKLFVKTTDYPKLYKFLGGYYEFYLEKCGFEERFERAVKNLMFYNVVWNIHAYPTLGSYLMSRPVEPDEVLLRLAAIEEISDRNNISGEIDCIDEQEARMLKLFTRIYANKHLHVLAIGYFGLFLEKCGYEKRFKRAFDPLVQHYGLSQSPSASYKLINYFTMRRPMENFDGLAVLSVVKELALFKNFVKETHCNEELLTKLLDWNAGNEKISSYQHLLRNYFSLYLDACGFEEIYQKSSNNEKLFDFLWEQRWQKSWPEQVKSTIKELNYLAGIAKEADCPKELIDNLLKLHAKSKQDNPEFYTLVRATLALYKSKCGLTDIDITV